MLQLLRSQKVAFVDDEDDTPPTLLFFGGQQAVGLGDQLGSGQVGMSTQRIDDRHVQATRAECGRRNVDDVMRGGIELAGRGAHRDGLAHADLASDNAQQRLGDAKADARHRLLVAGSLTQLVGRNGF